MVGELTEGLEIKKPTQNNLKIHIMKKLTEIAKEVIKEEQERAAFDQVIFTFSQRVAKLKQRMIADGKLQK